FSRNAHHPDRCVGAACGGLDSDPAIRVRGTYPHLLCSKAARRYFYIFESPSHAVVAHDPRESWLRTRAAPISARRSLPTARRRCRKGKPAGVVAHRTFARKYRTGSESKPALAPKAPIDRATRPHDSGNLSAELALQ